jgi:hypothetical protein
MGPGVAPSLWPLLQMMAEMHQHSEVEDQRSSPQEAILTDASLKAKVRI